MGKPVLPGQQLLLKLLQLIRLDPQRRPRCAVAMVFGQVQHTFATGDLQVQRVIRFESMLPVDLEPQEIDVELHCLGFVENTQDRSCFAEAHRVAPRQ
ncbi:hypothetical protein D3C86_1711080 [compost metagenome]